jgi:hypothetical protein
MSLDLYFCSLRNQHADLGSELILLRDDAASRKKTRDFQRMYGCSKNNNPASQTHNDGPRNSFTDCEACPLPPLLPLRLKSPAGSLRKTRLASSNKKNGTKNQRLPSSSSFMNSLERAIELVGGPESEPLTPRGSNRRSSFPGSDDDHTETGASAPPRLPQRRLSSTNKEDVDTVTAFEPPSPLTPRRSSWSGNSTTMNSRSRVKSWSSLRQHYHHMVLPVLEPAEDTTAPRLPKRQLSLLE